jgi:hypothetical protein
MQTLSRKKREECCFIEVSIDHIVPWRIHLQQLETSDDLLVGRVSGALPRIVRA